MGLGKNFRNKGSQMAGNTNLNMDFAIAVFRKGAILVTVKQN